MIPAQYQVLPILLENWLKDIKPLQHHHQPQLLFNFIQGNFWNSFFLLIYLVENDNKDGKLLV